MASSTDMIYSILAFLDASPLTLFNGAPNDSDDFILFYEDIFASFTTYLITDDDRIRFLTNAVARKIMTECSGPLLQKGHSLGPRASKYNFWKST
jgi:neurofibromin 1